MARDPQKLIRGLKEADEEAETSKNGDDDEDVGERKERQESTLRATSTGRADLERGAKDICAPCDAGLRYSPIVMVESSAGEVRVTNIPLVDPDPPGEEMPFAFDQARTLWLRIKAQDAHILFTGAKLNYRRKRVAV